MNVIIYNLSHTSMVNFCSHFHLKVLKYSMLHSYLCSVNSVLSAIDIKQYTCKTAKISIVIRPSFDGRIMLWRCPSVRTSVRPSVRPYVRPSVRPSVRSVVHNPCGQDIARTIWPRMLKLSMYT